jgi:hypothetical protein
MPYLPLLQDYKSKDESLGKRFMADYSRLVSDMMIENHFAQSVKIADQHGIEMVTEAGHGGYPRVDPLKALGNSHIPMGEFWNRQRFWVNKEASSAAHIYGKKLVASESLTGWNHWQHGPTDFKQLIDIAFCEGLNQVVFHTFSHNPAIAGKPGFVYHAGEHVNVNATWWDMANPFMDYIARSSFLLRQGNFVGDVLVYYGDQAPNLVPSKRIDPNITPIYDSKHCLHCGRPKPIDIGVLEGYDYDFVNEDVITTTLSVKEGKLELPHGQSYRVMALPDTDEISLEVLKSLEKLIFEGAVVIGRKPQISTSLKNYPECDREVKEIADRIWGDSDGEQIFSNSFGKGKIYWGKSVQEVLMEEGIGPDFQVKGIDTRNQQIDFIHRKTGNEEIYFVSNSSEKTQHVTCIFRVDPNLVPEIWDAETGQIQRNVSYTKTDKGITLDMTMFPLGSRFVVFKNKESKTTEEEPVIDLQFGLIKSQNQGEKIESIDLSENWELSFDTRIGGPASFQLGNLISWSEIELEGIKYYSGEASYSRSLTLDKELIFSGKEAFIGFEDIQEMARVFVNGKDCGIIWLPPYQLRITPFLQAGNNTITVKVVNTWNNRIVGDLNNPNSEPFTRTNIKNRFKKETPLLKSGLIGKAQIDFVSQ